MIDYVIIDLIPLPAELDRIANQQQLQDDLESDSKAYSASLTRKDIDLRPTAPMAEEAQRGLAWREEFGRGGTEVGVARARDISNRKNLSPETINRMVSYFARHEVDKRAQGFRPGEEGYPSAGRIAWALWGGDPGKAWAERKQRELQKDLSQHSYL
jgi:hypothetical protein